MIDFCFLHYMGNVIKFCLWFVLGTIMTISKDRVKPSPMPDSWKLNEIFETNTVIATYLALVTISFPCHFLVWLQTFHRENYVLSCGYLSLDWQKFYVLLGDSQKRMVLDTFLYQKLMCLILFGVKIISLYCQKHSFGVMERNNLLNAMHL